MVIVALEVHRAIEAGRHMTAPAVLVDSAAGYMAVVNHIVAVHNADCYHCVSSVDGSSRQKLLDLCLHLEILATLKQGTWRNNIPPTGFCCSACFFSFSLSLSLSPIKSLKSSASPLRLLRNDILLNFP